MVRHRLMLQWIFKEDKIMKFMECLLTETDDKERGYLFDAIMLSKLIYKRIGYYQLADGIEDIREVGYNLANEVYVDVISDEDIDVINKACNACEDYSKKFHQAEAVTAESLGLTFEEFLVFGRLVNNNPFKKMLAIAVHFRGEESVRVEDSDTSVEELVEQADKEEETPKTGMEALFAMARKANPNE